MRVCCPLIFCNYYVFHSARRPVVADTPADNKVHLREVKLYEIAISLADLLVFEEGCKIQIGRTMWESPGAQRAANGAVCTRTVSV